MTPYSTSSPLKALKTEPRVVVVGVIVVVAVAVAIVIVNVVINDIIM